jgi:hypothetical protein
MAGDRRARACPGSGAGRGLRRICSEWKRTAFPVLFGVTPRCQRCPGNQPGDRRFCHLEHRKTWIPGSSPGMTLREVEPSLAMTRREGAQGPGMALWEVGPSLGMARGQVEPRLAVAPWEVEPGSGMARAEVGPSLGMARGQVGPSLAMALWEVEPGSGMTRAEVEPSLGMARGEVEPGPAMTRQAGGDAGRPGNALAQAAPVPLGR